MNLDKDGKEDLRAFFSENLSSNDIFDKEKMRKFLEYHYGKVFGLTIYKTVIKAYQDARG